MKHISLGWMPVLVAGWLGSSCAPPDQAAHRPVGQDGAPVFVPVDGEAGPDDMARFLAGLPVRRGKTVSDIQRSAEYAAHEAAMRGMWTGRTRHRIASMSEWAAQNIHSSTSRDRVLFYPFGGPDLLHAEAMFGNIPTKILMGLEPVGWLPNTAPVAATDLIAALPAYREATRTQMQTGFFITKDMKTDLDASVLRGVTPLMLATVSLMGGTVLGVNAMPAGPYQAVRVDYRNAAGDSNTAIYVCGDLSNSGFRNYRAFLDSFGRGSTYFKAASYLMHDGYFSQARDYFLAASNNIVEDDSGIPFRHFVPGLWDIRCYGNYQAPIPLFAEHMQPDLHAAYLAAPGPQLTFGSGYHYSTETANLIHATRK